VDVDGRTGWQFTGPFGQPLPQPNYSADLPCAREILDTYRIFLGNAGYDSYPVANDDDKLQHCITSCRLARACGENLAAALGSAKELRDALTGDGADKNDLDANRHGRNGVNCPEKSCEDYCNQTRGQYGNLPPDPPTPPPPPGFSNWGGF